MKSVVFLSAQGAMDPPWLQQVCVVVSPDQPPEAAETQEPGADGDVGRAPILRVPSTAQLPAHPAPHHPPDQAGLQHPAQ